MDGEEGMDQFPNILEAADVITEDLWALSLGHQVIGQQLQLHDHVGQPGRDLLLQEVKGTLKGNCINVAGVAN